MFKKFPFLPQNISLIVSLHSDCAESAPSYKKPITYLPYPKFNKHTYLRVSTCPVTLFFLTATFARPEIFYEKQI